VWRSLASLSILVCAVLILGQPVQAQADVRPKQKFPLLVGVDCYENQEYNTLKVPGSDVTPFKTLLIERYSLAGNSALPAPPIPAYAKVNTPSPYRGQILVSVIKIPRIIDDQRQPRTVAPQQAESNGGSVKLSECCAV